MNLRGQRVEAFFSLSCLQFGSRLRRTDIRFKNHINPISNKSFHGYQEMEKEGRQKKSLIKWKMMVCSKRSLLPTVLTGERG